MSSPMRRVFLLLTGFLLPAWPMFASRAFAADTTPATLLKIFQPPVMSLVAMAPDGGHVAYVVREMAEDGVAWSIVIVDVTTGRDVVLPVREERRIYPGGIGIPRLPPIAISYLQWASPDLLTYYNGWAVRAVDSEGKNDHKVADQYDLGIAVAGGPVGVWTARPIRVENVLPGKPGMLVVSVSGRVLITLVRGDSPVPQDFSENYLLDLNAGTWKSLGEFLEGGTYVRDLQGRPRLHQNNPVVTMPSQTTHSNGPMMPGQTFAGGQYLDPAGVHFSYRDVTEKEVIHPLFGVRHWVKLEDFVGKESGAAFDFRPEESFRQQAFPLGFAQDPNVLYYVSNRDQDTYVVYALDLRSKQTAVVLAEPTVDLANPQTNGRQNLVLDRRGNLAGIRVNDVNPRTVWFDPHIAAFQAKLDARLPGHAAEILDWDEARTHFLVSVSSAAEPGGYWVADAGDLTKPKLVLSRSKDPTTRFNPSTTFEFDSPAGVHLTGTITRPLASRVTPAPAVIYCHPVQGRASGSFNRVTQALATLGFVVVDVNYRGTSGFGTALREGLRKDPDGPVDDILATLAWVKANYPIDAKRVALYGDDLGGYFALRALERHPELFRAGVARRPPESINDWIATGGSVTNPRTALLGWNGPSYSSYSITKAADDLARPVLLIGANVRENLAVKSLASTLSNDLLKPETITRTDYIDPDNGWVAEPELYLRIGAFLNDAFFNYESSIGELKVLE